MSVPAPDRRQFLSLLAAAGVLEVAGCGGGGGSAGAAPDPTSPTTPTGPAAPVDGPAWWGFARDAQHSGQGGVATQDLTRIVWRTAVDLAPQYRADGALLIH